MEVADNGPGVPTELRDRIFNAFFTTKPQGSGLGLAIVRKVVDAHDGRIDIQTGAHGTRFRVTLPVSGANDWFVPRSDAASSNGRLGRRGRQMGRILIADDHDALRRGLARALTAAGHEVEEAPNGNQAIERLHDGHFDVVLSDLKMGGSDGLDVLRTTKTLHPSTAVILMTAFGSVHTAVEAMKIGAFDYVQKPFEIEEMEVKIEKALEMRRMRHELDYLRHTQNDIYDFDRIVGTSDPLQRVLGVVAQGGEEQHDGADSRRDGHGQGAHRRRHPSQLAAGDAQLRQGELRGAAGERCSSRSCSVTRRARSPAPTGSASAASSRPTAAACSSTRSAT